MNSDIDPRPSPARLFGDPTAENWLIRLTGDSKSDSLPSELALLDGLNPGKRRCLAAFAVRDWNEELSPWEAQAVFGSENFGRGAERTLRTLEESWIPKLERAYPAPKRNYFLCGYSLAGLFALWAACQTDRFAGVAAVSPSVWFPGWLDYARTHPIRSRTVYLSLGDREEKAKNPRLATVGDSIRAQHALLLESGILSVLEWNPGNHFTSPPLRMAKALAWLEREEEKSR